MVKLTQTIRRLKAGKLFVFDHFVGLTLEGLKNTQTKLELYWSGKWQLSKFLFDVFLYNFFIDQ